MASCEKLEKCPFFNEKMAAMPAVIEMLKKRYCLSDKSECARYRIATAGMEVPMDLFPHERERAQQLLDAR